MGNDRANDGIEPESSDDARRGLGGLVDRLLGRR
jgi:hypothetical protein